MAFAAAYAARNAKDWFKPKRYEIAYSISRDLISKRMFFLDKKMSNIESHLNFYFPDDNEIIIKKHVDYISKLVKETYNEINDIFSMKFDLERHGWFFKEDYADIENLKDVNDFDMIIFSLDYKYPDNYINQTNKFEGYYTNDSVETFIEELKAYINDYLSFFIKISSNHDVLYDDFFDIK
ncbi:hypothetical protein SOASR016_00040 [Pectobacterium carotovorum subsp. carotovorum]|nr:hypothetical protein SOASR016_00040 [Pectobacterium carotovorum subsp. carotovorum]